MPLTLTCRCGWQHEFTQEQTGKQLHCPRCDRAILVTDNPAAFANANTGAADFRFAEDPAAPETPIGAAKVFGKLPATHRRRARGAVLSQLPRPVGVRAAPGTRRRISAFGVILAAVLVLGGGGVVLVAFHSQRTDAIQAAHDFGERLAEHLSKPHGTQDVGLFLRADTLEQLVRELQTRREFSGGAPVKLDRVVPAPGWLTGPETCELRLSSAGLNRKGRRAGYQIMVTAEYAGRSWRASRFHVRDSTPAELTR